MGFITLLRFRYRNSGPMHSALEIKNGISYDSWKSWKVINKDFRGCYRYYVLFNGRGVFLSDKGSCFSAAAGNIIELEKQPMHFKSKQSLKIFSPKLAI